MFHMKHSALWSPADAQSLRPGTELSTIPAVVDQTRLHQLLQPFGLDLTPEKAEKTLAYLTLLLRWNQKINLTAIRDPEECVTRHFGESLFIARHMQLHGSLLDIGSGAGFPGLALKIAFPEISTTLLEPVAKKRAFLKEAARTCGFDKVNVRADAPSASKTSFASRPSQPSTLPPCARSAIWKFSFPWLLRSSSRTEPSCCG
jgi:hypothetical protein